MQQYQHNKDFLDKMSKDYDSNYFDWKITTLFYIILHYADALLAGRGHHPGGHPKREAMLEGIMPDREYRLYLRLWNASVDSRYKTKFLGRDTRPACLRYYQECYIPLQAYFKSAI